MAKKITSGADAEDELTAIRYAHSVDDPRFLICRGEGRHRPHLEASGRYKDVRRDSNGGFIIETWCDFCDQRMIRRLFSDYRVNGGWKILYEKGEGGYLAKPGEGLGLTSTAGRAAFRRMQFEGVPDVDQTAPRGRRQRRPTS